MAASKHEILLSQLAHSIAKRFQLLYQGFGVMQFHESNVNTVRPNQKLEWQDGGLQTGIASYQFKIN